MSLVGAAGLGCASGGGAKVRQSSTDDHVKPDASAAIAGHGNTDAGANVGGGTEPASLGESVGLEWLKARDYKASAEDAAHAISLGLLGQAASPQFIAAVQSGAFSTDAGARAAVKELLNDPQALAHLGSFGNWWLGDREGQPLPVAAAASDTDSAALQTALLQETSLFTQSVLSGPRSGFAALLTSTHTFGNAQLGALYGLSLPGEAFQRIELPRAERRGLLTQLHFLATHASTETSPILRGLFVQTRLLCAPPPAHPPGVPLVVPERESGVTTRQHLGENLGSPACASCHESFTAAGFAFEVFDGFGRYRAAQEGSPIQTDVELATPDGDTLWAADAQSLMEELAGSAPVRQCLSTYWLTFSLGRAPSELSNMTPLDESTGADACAGEGSESTACAPAQRLKALVLEANRKFNDVPTLAELAVEFATNPALVDATFPCGGRRCLRDAEYCRLTPASQQAAGVMTAACLEMPPGASCAALAGDECSCEEEPTGLVRLSCG